MGERRKLDKTVNGLNYKNRSFMVAGYLDDYKLTYDADILGELEAGEKTLTVADFEENRGYVDESGYVHIFREHPSDSELIPWFTVIMGDDGKPKLKFNKRRSEETRAAFRIERVGDLSIKNIIDTTTDGEVEYDPEVLNDIMRATSTFIPDIKDNDDFLKKLIKTIIIEKGVNVHKYKKKMQHSYELSNMLQGLSGTTKISPFVFAMWMELLGCDFEIKIVDNRTDSQDPLKDPVVYKSKTNEIRIMGKEQHDENISMPRSARQYN